MQNLNKIRGSSKYPQYCDFNFPINCASRSRSPPVADDLHNSFDTVVSRLVPSASVSLRGTHCTLIGLSCLYIYIQEEVILEIIFKKIFYFFLL
jgi:hypothetical protein